MYKTFGQDKMHALIQAMASRTHTFSDDLQQAIGLDLAHLENQWHLYLGQPPTLSQSQQTQNQSDQTPTKSVAISNSTNPALITLGITLISISILTFSGLTIYQRRRKQKLRLQQQQQGQQVPITPYPPFPNQGIAWYPPINPTLPQSQPPQAWSTMPNVHSGNYTTPEAYIGPTMQQPPFPGFIPPGAPGYNPPYNPQGPDYPWYPQYPPKSGNPPRPPAPQE
jgi:hypothetical protein